MTLEEAHKIQRRELMSLRAENKRLKKQLSDDFPIEEKESLLRRIRHLEQIVSTNAKKHKSAHKRWKYSELRCNSLIAENDNLKKQILVLSDENALTQISRILPFHLLLCHFERKYLIIVGHPDVDYTNNICERELRKFKRKQKQAVVFRSDSGAQHICDALTIIETARMQNKNVIDIVTNSFEKH